MSEVQTSNNSGVKFNEKDRSLSFKKQEKASYKLRYLPSYKQPKAKKIFKCSVCKETFKNKISLDAHKRTHNEETSLVCNICRMQFLTWNKMKAHLINQHNNQNNEHNDEIFSCVICHKVWNSKYYLDRHLRLSHIEKTPKAFSFPCQICQKLLSSNETLKQHLRTHTGEKPYKCDICQEGFTFKASLDFHLLKHANKKPFECDICGKNFFKKQVLKSHLRSHTGEKPYECEVCQRRFSAKISLLNHLRRHRGEKPFECDFCQESFLHRISLKRHLRVHTKD